MVDLAGLPSEVQTTSPSVQTYPTQGIRERSKKWRTGKLCQPGRIRGWCLT